MIPTVSSSTPRPVDKTVDKSSERVREMFSQIAGKYDFMNHLLSLNIDRAWRNTTVRMVPPFLRSSGRDGVQADDLAAAPILDLCTGTGDLAFAYRRQADPSVEIIGADFCPEMLDVARRKQSQRNVTGISFVEASAMALPFADDHFQIVSVAFGLRNIEDTDQGLQEMVRVCRPGGRVAVLEFSQPKIQPLKGMYDGYFRYVLPRLGQWLARNNQSAYEYLPSSVREFPSGQGLVDRMERNGLIQLRFIPLTFGIATLYFGTKANRDPLPQ